MFIFFLIELAKGVLAGLAIATCFAIAAVLLVKKRMIRYPSRRKELYIAFLVAFPLTVLAAHMVPTPEPSSTGDIKAGFQAIFIKSLAYVSSPGVAAFLSVSAIFLIRTKRR